MFSTLFLAELVFRMALSEDPIRHWIGFHTVVDYLTVAPVILNTLMAARGFNVLGGGSRSSELLQAIRAARVFRAVRILKLARLAPSYALERQVFFLAVMVLSLVFVAAGVYQALEAPEHARMLRQDAESDSESETRRLQQPAAGSVPTPSDQQMRAIHDGDRGQHDLWGDTQGRDSIAQRALQSNASDVAASPRGSADPPFPSFARSVFYMTATVIGRPPPPVNAGTVTYLFMACVIALSATAIPAVVARIV